MMQGARMMAIGLLLLSAPALANEASIVCDSAVPVDAERAQLRATDPLVVGRIVFVSFPDEYQTLPVWAESMRAELTDYIAAMSRGRQHLDLSVLTRPDTPGRAWLAAHPASYYQDPSRGLATLNQEIMTRIDSLLPNAWNGVEQVFMVHYQCGWTSSECSAVGWATLGFVGAGHVQGFDGQGTTQRIIGTDVDAELEENTAKHLAGHEYGHTLGFGHTPGTDPRITLPEELVHVGSYDVMTASASFIRERGLFPYHPMWLSDPTIGWVPRQVIVTDTVALRIPDVRGPRAVVYQVQTQDPTQSFLLVNHQASTPWDAKYGNRGLLIWHLLGPPPYRAWDLESADGKFVVVNGQLDRTEPDPVAGMDAIEASPSWLGSGADFFDGAITLDGHPDTRFAPDTNPQSDLYSGTPPLYSAPQSVPTSLSFENIRRDPGNGDILVDIHGVPHEVIPQPTIAQNSPNPFARTTTIRLDLPTSVHVKVEIFDLQGRRVRVLEDRVFSAGLHNVGWDGRDAAGTLVPASIYLCRLDAGSMHAQRKMVLLAGPAPRISKIGSAGAAP